MQIALVVVLAAAPVGLSVGNDRSCARTAEGAWRCWGLDSFGSLGAGVPEPCGPPSRPAPCVVKPSAFEAVPDAVAFSFGWESSCAVKKDGTVWCWGADEFGSLGQGGAALDTCIEGGGKMRDDCSLGLTTAAVTCKGEKAVKPIAKACAKRARKVEGIAGATGISAGTAFHCAWGGGKAWCWGTNFRWQTGQPEEGLERCGSDDSCSKTARALPIAKVQSVTTGSEFGAALADKKVFTWGFNHTGQRGRDGEPLPGEIAAMKGATALVTGDTFAFAQFADGSVKGWGNHSEGQLALGDVPKGEYGLVMRLKPVPIPALKGAKVISAAMGASHACAVFEGGTLSCWGQNEMGQLGVGDQKPRTSPVKLALKGVTAVAVGHLHTCAIAGGEVYCWGANQHGQAGQAPGAAQCKLPFISDGSTVGCHLTPVKVPGL